MSDITYTALEDGHMLVWKRKEARFGPPAWEAKVGPFTLRVHYDATQPRGAKACYAAHFLVLVAHFEKEEEARIAAHKVAHRAITEAAASLGIGS